MSRVSILISLLIVLGANPVLSAPANEEALNRLKIKGTTYRLRDQFERANKIAKQMKRDFPHSASGYTFNLNTLVTRLSWDSIQTQYDQQIIADADKALAICEQKINRDGKDHQGYYDCGQAHFALTYLNALRGNYYRGGVHGTRTIKNLERALNLDPTLTDAKMHLGSAYYFADNLPYYIKAVSHVLWFVPTGNSSKSLPYVKEVTERGTFFRDVSKFIYSNLLIDGTDEDRQQAVLLLLDLVDRYPENRRFHLRYISLLIEMQRYEQSLQASQHFVRTGEKYDRQPVDLALAQLWASRAYLGLQDTNGATAAFDRIPGDVWIFDFPSWGKSWYQLTLGQISDLKNKRTTAIAAYQQIVDQQDYPSPAILAAARKGLKVPFSLNPLP